MRYPEPKTAEEAVANGVELLDAKGPAGWRDRIDLGSLAIRFPEACVLGQVYGQGGWTRGKAALGLPYLGAAHLYGFCGADEGYDNDDVQAARVAHLSAPRSPALEDRYGVTEEALRAAKGELEAERQDDLGRPWYRGLVDALTRWFAG